MVLHLEFDVATGLYRAGGKEILNAVRRAASHPTTVGFVKRTVLPSEDENTNKGTWVIVLLSVSFYAAVIATSLLSYMLRDVVATLCMVETPHAAITISPSAEPASKEEKETLLETGPVITLVRQKPITSTIRGTIKHVVAHAGRFARFRGLKIQAVYSLVFALAVQFFSAFFLSLFPTGIPGQAILISGLAGAAVANVHAAWTHKVVSMPSEVTFWQRIPSKAHWKTLAPAAAISTAMPYVSLYLTAGVAMLLDLQNVHENTFSQSTRRQRICLGARILATVVFGIFTTLFLCIPATVTQVRIESSILPEDQDTIVPFDRTFGGKVVSQALGGTGKIGFLDAWRSFNWEARRRLLKLYVKIGAILTFAMSVIVFIIVFAVLVSWAFNLADLPMLGATALCGGTGSKTMVDFSARC